MNGCKFFDTKCTIATRASWGSLKKSLTPLTVREPVTEKSGISFSFVGNAGQKPVRANHASFSFSCDSDRPLPSKHNIEKQIPRLYRENTLASDLQAGGWRFVEDPLTERT